MMQEQDTNTNTNKIDVRRMVMQLTIMLAVLGLAASGFAELADEVREGDTLTIDENILKAVYQVSSPILDGLFQIVSILGDTMVVAIVSALLCAALYRKRYVYRALFVAVAMGGIGLLIIFLKLIFERPRPELWQQIVTETSFSFPSGHATASSALAICLVMIFWQSRWRYLVLTLSVVYILLVGLSRLYLGVHYPSDVVGGWTLGALWLAAVGFVLNTHFLHKNLHLNKQ